MSDGLPKIWGMRKPVKCPSGQVATIRIVSMTDLITRGKFPLQMIDSPVMGNRNGSSDVPTEESRIENMKFRRIIVEAGTVSPVIGQEVEWGEIPDADVSFLFDQIIEFQKVAGGLTAAAVGGFPEG